MANYNGFYRTNYFKVKDEELFKEAIRLAKATSEDMDLFESDTEAGAFAIAGYGEASFWMSSMNDTDYAAAEKLLNELGLEDPDEDDNILFEILQKLVAEDDAIIYKESGHEKLRYVALIACAITSKAVEWITVDQQLIDIARSRLDNPGWMTQMDY